MSAETRSLLPDWHQRPIPWRVIIYHVDDLANYLTKNSPKVRALSRRRPRFTPDEWKPLDLKPHVFSLHRRSSCLTIYNPLGIQPSIEGTYRIDGPNWIKL